MAQRVEAIYENGVLRPLQPLHLKESEIVNISLFQEEEDSDDDMVDHTLLAYAREKVASMQHIPTHRVNSRYTKIQAGSML